MIFYLKITLIINNGNEYNDSLMDSCLVIIIVLASSNSNEMLCEVL